MTATVRVIVITGSMGAGKTTVLGEASDLLAAHGITHAAIDLDALGVSHLTESRIRHRCRARDARQGRMVLTRGELLAE
jgi:adenylate kinase